MIVGVRDRPDEGDDRRPLETGFRPRPAMFGRVRPVC
jgi:hypothetical protein